MSNKDIQKEFESTKEYKAWQESLLAIIGYASEEHNDEKLADELLKDHFNASLELQKGLERSRYEAVKMLNRDLLEESMG